MFLQHLSEVVHIPHTKMQKYTDIYNYLHITEGNYGNSCICISIFQKEQIILDNILHIDHGCLKAEQINNNSISGNTS